jgi:hypothetical protein
MSTFALTWRYLFNKATSEEARKPKFTGYALLFIFLALTAAIFYLLGQLEIDRTVVTTIIMVGCLIIGSANGYIYLANYHAVDVPNAPKSLNLWLETLSSVLICKVFALVTLVPLFLSQGFPVDALAIIKLLGIVVLSSVSLCLIGNLIFLSVRRVSFNPFLRSLLVIGLALLFWRSLNLWGIFFERIILVLDSSDFQATSLTVIGLIGVLGFCLGALELMFYRQRIKPRELPRFWQMTFANRALTASLGSGPALFTNELLRIIRDATWQRKLILYWLLFAVTAGIAKQFLPNEISQERLTIFVTLLASTVAGLLVSYQSGRELIKGQENIRHFPVKTSTRFFALFWASAVVTLVVGFFFASFSFIDGSLNSPINFLNFAIMAFIIQLTFFCLAVIGEDNLSGRQLPITLLIVLGLILIPTYFYQVVPLNITLAVIAAWLMGLWLITRFQVSKVLADVR